MNLPRIDVCLSPELYSLYSKENQIVIVVDVIRASTSICVAIANGVNKIIPVDSIEKAEEYRGEDYILSGERDSLKIESFDLGNSPQDFNSPILVGKDLVMTTTNGTRAISVAKNSFQLLIGTFINSEYLINYLLQANKDILVLCSGWKGSINIEDTLFAGFLANKLLSTNRFESVSDSVSLARTICDAAGDNMYEYIINSSPRLKSKLSYIDDDIKMCLFGKPLNVLPNFVNGEISNMKY